MNDAGQSQVNYAFTDEEALRCASQCAKFGEPPCWQIMPCKPCDECAKVCPDCNGDGKQSAIGWDYIGQHPIRVRWDCKRCNGTGIKSGKVNE